MADHLAVEFRHQRHCQRPGGAQRFYDELLGVLADFERGEGGEGDGGNGVSVGGGAGGSGFRATFLTRTTVKRSG